MFDVVGDNVMAFYTGYWAKNVPNSGFDYDEWTSVFRGAAVDQLAEENRPHPLPTIEIDPVSEIRIALNAGDVTMFSTCQLHATADNVSGKTRFSYDLRTISLSDLVKGEGPQDMDRQATGSTLADFIRVSDFKPLEVASLRPVLVH